MLRFLKITCVVLLFSFAFSLVSVAANSSRDFYLSQQLFYSGIFSTHFDVARNNDQLERTTTKPTINYGRLALVGGLLLGTMVGIHIYQEHGWWKDNRAPFHFREDLRYGLHVDKIGHFWGAAVLAEVIRSALEWACLSERDALLLGAGGSLLFQTFIEVEDGFSKWGFDRVDFLSNVAGTAWPIARYYFPILHNVDLKFSYHPSPLLHQSGGTGFPGQKHLIMDDYEGQTFWLSVNVNDALPKAIEPYWPDFLRFALGYGARDIKRKYAYRVYFVAVDYDVSKIIPNDTPLLRTINKFLSYIHLPAPAVQIHPTTIWYGLYF